MYWGILPVGRTTISCDHVITNGHPYVRIRFRARSNRLVGTLYPVDDTIDCLVDPESGLPVELRKHTREGDFVANDILRFDRGNLRAHWTSSSAGIVTNYPSPPRRATRSPSCSGENRRFLDQPARNYDVAVDGQIHRLSVTPREVRPARVKGLGTVPCLRLETRAHTDGLSSGRSPRRSG